MGSLGYEALERFLDRYSIGNCGNLLILADPQFLSRRMIAEIEG